MNFQFTHALFLLFLPVALAWTVWWFLRSDVQISPWRRWTAFILRLIVLSILILGMAGLQRLQPKEGMNVFFLLDRSESIPAFQQEAARRYVNQAAQAKRPSDRAGVLVFGTEAAIESSAAETVNLEDDKVLAVVGTDRTDIAGAIRLGTAAFPETGQKRLVLLSDGNENIGDAFAALLAARPLGVSLDVIPLGAARARDTSLQKLGLPSRVKKGTTFETKIFIEADQAQTAKVRLYRNEEPLGEKEVPLSAGKNLFTFPQQLTEAGFYRYNVRLDSPGDLIPQNNQATGFIHVRGDPRILVLSADPTQDRPLVEALLDSQLDVTAAGLEAFPSTLAEMQSYDTIFISNLSAGDLGRDRMQFLENAVKDFGVGLVCIGGDQAYAAGGYRNTPLEAALPLNMELDSKKVLPNGAVALVMHGMEFNNGNQVARDCAQGVLDALGPQDELGVVLWDGTERWLFPLTKVADKGRLRKDIAGMNQGDLPAFQGVMNQAYMALRDSKANIKHMIIFSDGDPAPPTQELMAQIREAAITVSTVLISGHFGPDVMIWIAEQGRGRYYDVHDPSSLPQIFVKEAAVILKSAIFEGTFKPSLVAATELTRGIDAGEFPVLRGYVATTPKARAEIALVSDKADPILGHWQYGLGRSVAFTSDAKARWAKDWLGWPKYRQFWSQIAQWSLRRIENADLSAEVTIENGQGQVVVEALDAQGNYRNFLELQSIVVSPKGERQSLRLQQTGPGRYEAQFATKEIGSYLLNLMEMKDGQVAAAQVIGSSVNYSPEFIAREPNLNLLQRLAQSGGGKLLNPDDPATNPFLHDRMKTFQPHDLWEWLLRLAVILFVLDVGLRRIQIDREQWAQAVAWITQTVLFWRGRPRPVQADESLAALLSRRDQIRSRHARPDVTPDPSLFQPHHPGSMPEDTAETPALPVKTETKPASDEDQRPPDDQPPAAPTTTSRLLEAKRRAKKRME